MKVLVVGQGGREHAIVRALSLSPSVEQIHVIPGNPGMSQQAHCHSIDWKDFSAMTKFCLDNQIDFVFIGPEDPLVLGLADVLRERGLYVVGPNKEAARLEGSKVFAKHFMSEAQIPTARFAEVTSVQQVMAKASQFTPPYVLKADGLAAGKGVVICDNLDELKSAGIDFFEKKTLGVAGQQALLEQFTEGWELSYLVLTNGSEYCPLPIAQDHKRLQDHHKGPNTGGMGTVAPIAVSSDLIDQINRQIVEPTVKLIHEKGIVYRGIIFFGIMVTKQGPSLLEFNCRFGDPETQVILPLIEGDTAQIFYKLSKGQLVQIKSKNLCSCCVVMAAPGYPQHPEKGVLIHGDVRSETASSYFIHSGTGKNANGDWITNGGRVLGAVGLGTTLNEARVQAYQLVKKVKWQGLQFRTDIGSSFTSP